MPMRVARAVKGRCLTAVVLVLGWCLTAGPQALADDVAVLKDQLAQTSKGSEQWKALAHQLCSSYAHAAGNASALEIHDGLIACLDEMMQIKPKGRVSVQACLTFAENQTNIIELLRHDQSSELTDKPQTEIKAFNGAINCYKLAERPDLWAPAAYQVGSLYLQTMRPDQALLAFEDALTFYTKETNPLGWALVKQGIGLAFSNMPGGNRAESTERAIEAYEDAATILTRERDFANWLDLQNNLATTYLQRVSGDRADNIEEAIRLLTAMWTLNGDEVSAGRRLQVAINLSNAYQLRLKGDRAENGDRAIAVLAEASRSPNLSSSDLNFAKVSLGSAYLYRLRGDEDDNRETAIKLFREVISALSRNHALWATAEMNLGLALAQLDRGDPVENTRKAIDALTEALRFAQDTGQKLEWALAELNLGSLWGRRRDGSPADNQAQAIAAYRAALTVFTPAGDPQNWALAESGLSAVLWRSGSQGNSTNADAALAAGKAAFQVLSAGRYPRQHMLFSLGLAQRLLVRGDIRSASQFLDGAASDADRLIGAGLDEAETRDVLETVEGVFPLQALLAARRGDAAGALRDLNRGRTRLLRASLRLDTARLSPADRAELVSLRAAIRTKERSVEAATMQPVSTIKGTDIDALAALRAQAASLLSRGAANDPVSEAIRELKPGQVLVAPVLTPFGSTLLIAEQGGPIQAVPLPDGLKAQVDREAAAWIADYRKGDFALAVRNTNRSGGDALGEAVQEALAQAGVADGADLVILTDGKSSMLPWFTGAGAATGRMLLDRFQASFVPSLDAFVASSRRSRAAAAKTVGILSNPAQDAGLPAAPIEAALVAAAFGQGEASMLSTADAASPATTLAALGHQSYWHIIAHASFDWDAPRNSGIQLAGGQKLTVASLLESSFTPNAARLAVLSACETGISDAEHNADEFVGLPSALLETGLPAVVGSLWPVADLPTMLIMGRFYENHLAQAQRPALALRNAQLWLRNASRQDIEAYLSSHTMAGLISRSQLEKLRHEIVASYPGEQPFADPVNWSGFALYGE